MTQSLAATAALLCANPRFQAHIGVDSSEAAADHVRRVCGVSSRRELDSNNQAAERFHELRRRFAYGVTGS